MSWIGRLGFLASLRKGCQSDSIQCSQCIYVSTSTHLPFVHSHVRFLSTKSIRWCVHAKHSLTCPRQAFTTCPRQAFTYMSTQSIHRHTDWFFGLVKSCKSGLSYFKATYGFLKFLLICFVLCKILSLN